MNKRIILIIIFSIIAIASFSASWFHPVYDNAVLRQGIFLLAPLAAMIGAFFAFIKFGTKNSRALTFLFLTTGITYWFIGEVLFDYYDSILHISPFPSVADIFYIFGYPFIFAGLLNEVKNAKVNLAQIHKAARILFLFLAIVLATLVIYFGIMQAYNGQVSLFSNLIAMSYGVGDLLLILASLLLLVLVWEFRGGNLSRVWLVLTVSFSLTLIADILFALYTSQYNQHDWLTANALDSLWMAGYLCFAYAMFEFGFSIQDAYKKIITLRTLMPASREQEANTKNLDQTKDEFISFISHELRAPMGAVKGLVSMMLKGDYGPMPDRFRQPLTNVYVSAERQIRMINDILNISRFQSGTIRYTLVDFPLQKVANQVVEEQKSLAKQRRITLTVTNGTESLVQGDDIWVKQILDNVIGNAVKFTEAGSVTVTFHEEGDVGQVVVSDTGVGISSADQERLFTKFQQLTGGVLQKTIGSGLGLYISREVSRTMGGDVILQKSEPGKGSVFVFSLPKVGSQLAAETKSKLEKDGLLSLNKSIVK